MHRRGSLAPGATSVSPLISRAICNCAWPSRVSICRARMALAMSRRITATLTFRAAAISWWVKPSASQSNEASRSAALHLVVRETEFCGLRLAGYFRRRMRENSRNSVRRPRCASLTRRNYGGFCLPGNRPGLSGLHGGGCRDRTDGHRSLASLQNEAACRGFSARNDLSQRMSKSLAGKPKALTINRYLPVSLRFHSLSSRSRAMVVTCSRALRRLQE